MRDPTDLVHELWNEILLSPPVFDTVLEIPGRASAEVMDPMLAYFHNLSNSIVWGHELDPMVDREEEAPF